MFDFFSCSFGFLSQSFLIGLQNLEKNIILRKKSYKISDEMPFYTDYFFNLKI